MQYLLSNYLCLFSPKHLLILDVLSLSCLGMGLYKIYGSDVAILVLVFDLNPEIRTQIRFESEDYVNFIFYIQPEYVKPVSDPYPTRLTKKISLI